MRDEAGRVESTLARLAQRLEEVAAAVERLAPPGPPATRPGRPLDEATRASLEPLAHVLDARAPDSPDATHRRTAEEACRLALADRAALWLAGPDEGSVFVESGPGASSGQPLPPGEGLASRALADGEVILGRPEDAPLDPWMRRHGLTHAAAVPVPGSPGRPAGVLLAGRRRDVAFDVLRLGWLLVLAREASPTRAPAGPGSGPTAGGGEPPADGEIWELDPGRVAGLLLDRVAAAVNPPVAAVLAPGGPAGLTLLAARGLPTGQGTPPPVTLEDRLRAGPPADGDRLAGDRELTAWLGATPRLVAPLVAGGVVAGLLILGGPRPIDPRRLLDLLAATGPALRNARLHAATRAALAERQERPPASHGPPPPAPARDFGALLALVLGRLGSLREHSGLPPGVQRELEVIEEAAWRAAEAMRDVLGYGRGRPAESLAPVDPAEVLATAVARTEARWKDQSGGPSLRLDVEPLPPLRGSAVELVEAIEHVLDNAAEAAGPGGPVTLRGRWDGGGFVDLVVEDHGPGMGEEARARALEPFFSTRGPGRLGLGLSIAQAIVVRHRGDLDLASGPEGGTRVLIRLPTLAAAGRGEPAEPASRVRVLIIEDEPSVREALVAIVGRLGHVVLTAADGPEALDRLAVEPVGAVITDLALPGGSGLEVAREVQRVRPGTPVIVVTAWPGRLDPATLADSGVAAVVDKPVGSAELGTVLGRVLAGRSAPDE